MITAARKPLAHYKGGYVYQITEDSFHAVYQNREVSNVPSISEAKRWIDRMAKDREIEEATWKRHLSRYPEGEDPSIRGRGILAHIEEQKAKENHTRPSVLDNPFITKSDRRKIDDKPGEWLDIKRAIQEGSPLVAGIEKVEPLNWWLLI